MQLLKKDAEAAQDSLTRRLRTAVPTRAWPNRRPEPRHWCDVSSAIAFRNNAVFDVARQVLHLSGRVLVALNLLTQDHAIPLGQRLGRSRLFDPALEYCGVNMGFAELAA